MKSDVRLLKGNEAVAEAAVRSGCDGYFGYPITPQSEILETLMALRPWETSGMQVVQAESEVAAINMVYGGAAIGRRVMTSSSSPGISLICEGVSYIAAASLPCLIVNVQRGGPGLGTIQPSQGDYFQAVKGGGHGDYHCVVLAPCSVQEMYDFVFDAFEVAFRYRVPVIMLADGMVGQMMEKVKLTPPRQRRTQDEIIAECDTWALTGRGAHRQRNIVTSLQLQASEQEAVNLQLQAKYRQIESRETRWEEYRTEDAEWLLVAFGCSARICRESVDKARREGLRVGLLRPITLWPFPSGRIGELATKVKAMMTVELNAGQMVEDVRLAVNGRVPVWFYGRMGGVIFAPDEVLDNLKKQIESK